MNKPKRSPRPTAIPEGAAFVPRDVPRVMFIRSPRRLDPAQLKAALGGLQEDHPVWLAVNQLVDEELASAMLDVSRAHAPEREHAAGRIDACAALKQRLLATAGRLPAP